MSKYDRLLELVHSYWDELPVGLKGDLEVLEECDEDEM
jgi:hypothetical protein